jgi:hypothetical protein
MFLIFFITPFFGVFFGLLHYIIRISRNIIIIIIIIIIYYIIRIERFKSYVIIN